MQTDSERLIDLLTEAHRHATTFFERAIGILKVPLPAWTLPDPPPGQEWHRTDWTEDMLEGGWRPLLKGEIYQKDLDELYYDEDHAWVVLNHGGNSHDIAGESDFIRTRRPLPPAAPEPRVVPPAVVPCLPLEPRDIPPGTVIAYGEELAARNEWSVITDVHCRGLCMGNSKPISMTFEPVVFKTWQELKDRGFYIKRPGEDWQACSKPGSSVPAERE